MDGKGLVKAKRFDWKDSNIALFGSDQEKSIKKASSITEPAWQTIEEKVGMRIWRIVKFKITEWPVEDYGKFYSGDSYIVLNVYTETPESRHLCFDAHFWIGSQSTQDEYGTAAYKTVELDNYLDDRAVQHREVEGYESDLFRSYFPSITIMEGGAESGFRIVKPTEYQPRLLHFHGLKQHVRVKEVALSPNRLNANDVFILDLGLTLYQWNGHGSSKDERFKAMQYLLNLKSERGGLTKTETLEEYSTTPQHPFFEALTGEDEDIPEPVPEAKALTLYKVSDAAGHLKSTKIKVGEVSPSDLDSNDVFILDTCEQCFVWVGNGSTHQEKQNGLGYAHMHLMKTSHPLIPIHVIKEGQVSKAFQSAIAA